MGSWRTWKKVWQSLKVEVLETTFAANGPVALMGALAMNIPKSLTCDCAWAQGFSWKGSCSWFTSMRTRGCICCQVPSGAWCWTSCRWVWTDWLRRCFQAQQSANCTEGCSRSSAHGVSLFYVIGHSTRSQSAGNWRNVEFHRIEDQDLSCCAGEELDCDGISGCWCCGPSLQLPESQWISDWRWWRSSNCWNVQRGRWCWVGWARFGRIARRPTKASISHDEMATTILWHWTMFSGFETWHMSPMTPKSEIIIFSKNHNKQ